MYGGTLATGHVRGSYHRQRRRGRTHVVDGQRILGRRTPAVTVDVVVVRAAVVSGMGYPHKAAVDRHRPHQCGVGCVNLEMQIPGGIVHCVAPSVKQPDTAEVEGHVNLVAGVGVDAVEPHLIVATVDTLHPDVGDDDIGLQLVSVAAVDDQFVLCVEEMHRTARLAIGEITNGVGIQGHAGGHKDQGK